MDGQTSLDVSGITTQPVAVRFTIPPGVKGNIRITLVEMVPGQRGLRELTINANPGDFGSSLYPYPIKSVSPNGTMTVGLPGAQLVSNNTFYINVRPVTPGAYRWDFRLHLALFP